MTTRGFDEDAFREVADVIADRLLNPSDDAIELRCRQRVAALCEEHGIHTVECVFVDTWGMPRGKRLPVAQFLTGAGFAISGVAFSWNFRSDVEATPWFERDMGAPDMKAVPDLNTFRIAGWEEGMATVMCDMVDGHTEEPITMDGRGMLKKTIAEFRDMGYLINMATELEFHLFDENWNPISDQAYCYSMDRADELEGVLFAGGDVVRSAGLAHMGVRAAELRGYQYSRNDVDARSLANQYAQVLGDVFSTMGPKPLEVELLVVEVSDVVANDRMFHILYDGTLLEEKRFCVLGGDAEGILKRLEPNFNDNLDVAGAIRVAVAALTGPERTLAASDLEIASLSRNGKRRAFTRVSDDAVAIALR
jgi:proteasome alpha subunit